MSRDEALDVADQARKRLNIVAIAVDKLEQMEDDGEVSGGLAIRKRRLRQLSEVFDRIEEAKEKLDTYMDELPPPEDEDDG